MKKIAKLTFVLSFILLFASNAFAMRRLSGTEAVLVDGSLKPNVTLTVQDTISLERGRANPLVRIQLDKIQELFNGRRTHVAMQFFELDDNDTRIWELNHVVKIKKIDLDLGFKIIKFRLNKFLKAERFFEMKLIDDEGNVVNIYKFSFKLDNFTPVNDIGDLPIGDVNIAALQEHILKNLFIRQNNASIMKGTGDIYFIDLSKRARFSKNVIGQDTIGAIVDTSPGEDRDIDLGAGANGDGLQGPTGPQGPVGPVGPPGTGFELVGNAVVIGEPPNDIVVGSTQTADTGNPDNDSRMFFDKDKSAFRAGIVDGDHWDPANVGSFSVAFGANTIASGDWAIAAGAASIASGVEAVAFGENAIASGGQSVAIGNDPIASGQASVSLGNKTVASSLAAVSLGSQTVASGPHSKAIGREAIANSRDSVAIGNHVEAINHEAFIIGTGIDATDRITNDIRNSLMVGFNSNASTLFVGPSIGAGATGNVGIGNTDPKRKIHISGAMRLEPQANAPSNAVLGDIYVDDSDAVCVFASGIWNKITGAGTCI